MKRAIVLCLALIVSLFAVTGSIAYFTDNIATTNVVEAGNLHILQHEYERVKNGTGFAADADGGSKLQPYTQKQAIYPAVPGGSAQKLTIGEAEYDINKAGVNGFVDKIVVAENGGTLDAYVRTFVAVPAYKDAKDAYVTWIHLDKNVYNEETNPTGWVWSTSPFQADIGGVTYDVWYATSETLLEPGDQSSPSLLGYYLDSRVNHNGANYTLDGTNLGADSSLTILVATEAAQAIPMGIGDTSRLGAVESLNLTYSGDAEVNPGADRHPWKEANIRTASTQAALDAALKDASYNTQIGLFNGSYELPEQLPAGVRIFAMGDAVTLEAPDALSAQDVEFDSVIFEKAVAFTGWGAFEDCTFTADCAATATNGRVLFSKCVFPADKKPSGTNIIIKD